MKVKLFQFSQVSDGYYGDYETVLTQGISEWEEVTTEEYQLIQRNISLLQKKWGNLVLIAQPDISIPEVITSIKQAIKDAERAEQKRKDEAARKKLEAAEKKAAKAREKELIQFKKLQAKFEAEANK